MECKLKLLACAVSIVTELIETLWNVNTLQKAVGTPQTLELIETLWNVNTKILAPISLKIFELIETLWNVNLIATGI